MKKIVLLFCLTSCFSRVMAQLILPLYPDKIPNSIPGPDEEATYTDGWFRYVNISRPTLSVFLPPPNIANGTAVVICPGGGYGVVAFQHEGEAVAKELNKVGIAAFVLKYRIPNDKIMTDKKIGPLQDAQQAIKVVRERAREWKINPDRVGIAGFSAGGHLASTAGTHFDKPVIENKDNINLRPDFMILIYPVISFTDSLAHLGSRENLIGKNPSQELINYYSNELQVTSKTPTTFLVHAGDDDAVKVENSLRFYEVLKKNNVKAELFIFPAGSHGFGLINPTTKDHWMDRCIDWMQSNGWISSGK
ncbi:MAG TPA: alpha/beta hydrolase [Cyclobacteriaceae bacterium]